MAPDAGQIRGRSEDDRAGMKGATLVGVSRLMALAAGLVVVACGGIVGQDGSDGSGAGASGTRSGDEATAQSGAGAEDTEELPATCGEWIEAVTEAADRCGTFLYTAGFDEDRALSPELARDVCMPALRDTDCSAEVRGYMPDECEDACR